jgi:hypothetical protein
MTLKMIVNYIYSQFNLILPPLKFNLNKKKKKLSKKEADKWATDILERIEQTRRIQRGRDKNNV